MNWNSDEAGNVNKRRVLLPIIPGGGVSFQIVEIGSAVLATNGLLVRA